MDGRSATALTCLNVAHRCVFCLPEKMAGSTRAFLVAEMPEAEEETLLAAQASELRLSFSLADGDGDDSWDVAPRPPGPPISAKIREDPRSEA